MVTVLYAPRGVEMVHKRTGAMANDNMMQCAMSNPRLDMCAII